jgi:hypothetical protein
MEGEGAVAAVEIELSVLCPDGSTASIAVARNSRLGEAKRKIAESRGVPNYAVTLFMAGAEDALADSLQLDEARTVFMLLRPCDDRLALEALFKSAGGPDWQRKEGWMTDAELKDWEGVKGVSEEGRVIQLWLPLNNQAGELPGELGMLDALQTLSLYSTILSGSIPAELGLLASLKHLELSNNRLTGPIPPELGQLSSVEKLLLHGNELSGAIPMEMGKLSTLKILNLRGNQLSGAIPPDLGQLSSLMELLLEGNQLSGSVPAAELGQLASLGRLTLNGNQLSGLLSFELHMDEHNPDCYVQL